MSLRQLMFKTVFEELAGRAAKLPLGSNDYELIQALQTKQILTSTNGWNYMQWDSHAKTLKASSRDRISSEAASALIPKVHKLADQPDLIHRFSALKPMPPAQLTGSGLTQLILVRIRPSNLQWSPLAQAIASRLKR